MRKLILRMEITVDGVAASEKGPIDGIDYGNADSFRDIFETIQNVDGMLIGGRTTEEYLGYWKEALTKPGTKPDERRYAEIASKTPHYVVSRTMKTVNYPNASILSKGVDGIADLKRQSGKDLLMWGGPTVAAATIEAGLIDEMHFVIHPVVAGDGKRLFDKVGHAHKVRLLHSRTLSGGAVLVKYAVE